MNVDLLIEYVVGRYAAARFYSDRGVLVRGDNFLTVRARFETTFQRGGPFSFAVDVEIETDGEASRVARSYRFRADGEAVELVEPEWLLRGTKTLGDALTSFAGVSIGTARVMPRLLLPSVVRGRSVFGMHRERRLDGETTIDGEPHFVVTTIGDDEQARIFIAKSTFVVRRIEETRPAAIARRSAESSPPVTVTEFQAVLTPGFPTPAPGAPS